MISQILIVMIAAIAVTIFAEGRNVQPPLLLALVGLAASFIPGLPRLELDPEVLLTVLLPPLLYSAAREFSIVSFMRRLGSILNLGVVLILVTTSVVGSVAALVLPGLPLVAATVLAAVVSPPDAVTAVAIGRKLGLPNRLMTVLKGESLINDAAALTLFTFATAAVTGTHLFIENRFLFFGYSAVVGILVGVIIGGIVHRTRMRLTNAALSTVMSVLVPFAAYMIAEELGASGVLAVVAAGFDLGHNASETTYETRIQERQFWRTTDALLEAFVFAYIGLQLRFVIQDAAETGHDLVQLFLLSTIVLAAVILTRIGWVFASAFVVRWRYRVALRKLAQMKRDPQVQQRMAERRARFGRRGQHEARDIEDFRMAEPFSWKENLVIAWTGMRGVVTLAAAAGIPLTTLAGEAFPGRNVIQVVAFVVTIGTLLIQGLTLPWLIRALKIADPAGEAEHDRQRQLADDIVNTAMRETVTAYRAAHPGPEVENATAHMLQRMQQSDRQDDELRGKTGELMLELGRQMLVDRRAALIAARDRRELDDEMLREVLEEIDLQQATFASLARQRH